MDDFIFKPNCSGVTAAKTYTPALGLSGVSLNNRHSCSLAIPGLRTLDTDWFHFQGLIKSMFACRECAAAVSGL